MLEINFFTKKIGQMGIEGSDYLCTKFSSKYGLESPRNIESLDHYQIPQICLSTATHGLGLIANLAVYWHFYYLEGSSANYAFYQSWPG